MTWKEKMQEWGAGDITFLSSDGATLIFIVVDDPVLLHGKFKNRDQDRIGCPIITDEGYMLFITGKRTARKISQFETHFKDQALMVTRHGVEGDINATYEVSLVEEKEKAAHLLEIAKREFTPEAFAASIKAAEDVMKQ